LQDVHESTAADHSALKTTVERKITEHQARATAARESAAAARDRSARLKRGEAVAGGLNKPMTFDGIISGRD
jgi:hypothetical protein